MNRTAQGWRWGCDCFIASLNNRTVTQHKTSNDLSKLPPVAATAPKPAPLRYKFLCSIATGRNKIIIFSIRACRQTACTCLTLGTAGRLTDNIYNLEWVEMYMHSHLVSNVCVLQPHTTHLRDTSNHCISSSKFSSGIVIWSRCLSNDSHEPKA